MSSVAALVELVRSGTAGGHVGEPERGEAGGTPFATGARARRTARTAARRHRRHPRVAAGRSPRPAHGRRRG
ncbi:hypothetical protein, partial [Streptomyces leeuwenhoekii]|uniref:hypothetical protein n=1 Tax=Streptomyces leeuwenhoekii TaxID=1437453 RepID=UPI001C708648